MFCLYCGGVVVVINVECYGCVAVKDCGFVVCKGFLILRELVEKRLILIICVELLLLVVAVEFEKVFEEMLKENIDFMEDVF